MISILIFNFRVEWDVLMTVYAMSITYNSAMVTLGLKESLGAYSLCSLS